MTEKTGYAHLLHEGETILWEGKPDKRLLPPRRMLLTFLLILAVFRNFLFRSRVPFLMVVLTCFFGYIAIMGLDSLMVLLLRVLFRLLKI